MPKDNIKIKSLATVELPEETYKADIEVTNLFQSFSSELLRAALLGIAGYGFLISNVAFESGKPTTFFQSMAQSKTLLAVGVISLGLSAAFALAHRYLSSDCIVHQITLLRLKKSIEEPERKPDSSGNKEPDESESKIANLQRRFAKEKKGLHRKIRLCQWCLALASIALAFGASIVAITFARTMFSGAA